MFLAVRQGIEDALQTLEEAKRQRRDWKKVQGDLSREDTRPKTGAYPTTPMFFQTPSGQVSKKRTKSTPSPRAAEDPRPKRKQLKKQEEPWSTVQRKKQSPTQMEEPGSQGANAHNQRAETPRHKKQSIRRPRSEALLIRPAEGKKYVDILKQIKANVVPEQEGIKVKCVRQTRSGDLLVELAASQLVTERFDTRIKEAVGAFGAVRHLKPRALIEVRDVDADVEPEEVLTAVTGALPDADLKDVKVNLSKANRWGNKLAHIDASEAVATRLASLKHLVIGWTRCRVRLKMKVDRCYRCLGYGHHNSDCKGKDRRNLCWRCSKEGHLAANCSNTPHCGPCEDIQGVDSDHIPATARCEAYRRACQGRGNKKQSP